MVLGTSVTLGMIALFPQAVVPAVMKITGDIERGWFLALHAPTSWQWPIIAGMVAIGAGLLTLANALYRRGQSSQHPD